VNAAGSPAHERTVDDRGSAAAAPSFWTLARDSVRDPTIALWSVYILLTPVYVATSGLPQPGDLLVLFLVPAGLMRWDGRLPGHQRDVLRALLMFTAWVIVVNVAWSTVDNIWTIDLKRGFALSPIFYIYNVLVFLTALALYRRYRERFIQHTVRLTIVSVVVQTLISFVYTGGAARGKVLFNNANQLGYYAVVTALIIVLGQKRARISSIASTIGVVASAYLVLLSASKAGLASMAMILTFGMFDRLRTVVLVGIVSAGLLVVADPLMHLVNRASARVDKPDELGFVAGRGYDRIGRHPEDWLLGAGEGNYSRYWTQQQGAHEIHSSVGTIFFCYGAIGAMLFLWFAIRLFRGAPFRRMLLLVPVVAFGLSHQGLRSTLVWVLFALYVVLKEPDPAALPARARLQGA
jgi:hypothetical protein